MSTKFTFTKENIGRVRNFLDYVKKLESITAMNKSQTFVIDGNKLKLYAGGEDGTIGAGHVETVIDIKDVALDSKLPTNFVMEGGNFINFLGKIKSDEIFVEFDGKKITMTGSGKTKVSSAIFKFLADDELKEIEDHIKDIFKTEFKSEIEVDITNYKNEISELGALTKLLDIARQVGIKDVKKKTTITVADNLCIFSWTPTTKIIDENAEIFLDRDVANFFKNVDKFKISGNKKFYYFDVATQGIKVMFVPKASKWQYPTDQDLIDICPEDTKKIVLEVKAADFYNALESFEGIFESSTWRYKQVKVKVPTNFKDEVQLHFDNMLNEVSDTLPVTVKSKTDSGTNFEFIMPTLHFNNLKDFLYTDDASTFTIEFNSLGLDQPHGPGIKIISGGTEIIFAKMSE